MDVRNFTANFILPAGTQPGTYELKTLLESTYVRAAGVVLYKNSNGGISSFKMGLRDDTAVYGAPTHADFYAASTDCPKNQRFTTVDIPCNNTNLTVQFVLGAVLTTPLDVDVVFQLEGLKSKVNGR